MFINSLLFKKYLIANDGLEQSDQALYNPLGLAGF